MKTDRFNASLEILGIRYELRIYYLDDPDKGIKITQALLDMGEEFYQVPFSKEEGANLIARIRESEK